MNRIKVSPGTVIADDEGILLTWDLVVIARKGNIRLSKILVSSHSPTDQGIYEKEVLERSPNAFCQAGVDVV